MTRYWILILVCLGSPLLAQTRKTPPYHPPSSPCYNTAFPPPGAIDVCPNPHLDWPVRAFTSVSFTYWSFGEEGLGLSRSALLDPSGNLQVAPSAQALQQPFSFQPGWMATIGLITPSDWELSLQYVWGRQETAIEQNAPSTSVSSVLGSSVWIVGGWFLQTSDTGEALSATWASSRWKCSLDQLQATVSYPVYQSPCILLSPFGGIQTSWIRQSLTLQSTIPPLVSGNASNTSTSSENTSHAWGIGPFFGIQNTYQLPCHFSLYGAWDLSLLFTEYTRVRHSEDQVSTSLTIGGPYQLEEKNLYCMRPQTHLQLGWGWGRYFSDKRYHLDFSARYDFAYFWAQNMIRSLLDTAYQQTGGSAGALYLQGLTLTTRFDF